MKVSVTLKNDSVMLRSLRIADAEEIARLLNNRRVLDNLRDMIPFPYSVEDAKVFIAMATEESNNTIFGVEHDGAFCGVIGLHGQDDVYRHSAELGYWFGEEYWGKGIATKSVQLITEYGFEVLKLKRIYSGIFSCNPASMKVLEKCGYKLEGILKSAIIKNGILYDEYRYGMTEEDCLSLKKQ